LLLLLLLLLLLFLLLPGALRCACFARRMQINGKLQEDPKSVEAFVKRLRVQKEGDELMPRLRAGMTRIEELRIVMLDEQWPLSDSIKGHIMMLNDGTTLLEALLTKCEQEIEALTARFAKQISDAIPQLNKKVATTRQELDDAMISDADADENEVLSHLYTQKEAYEAHLATARKYQEYQSMLNQPVVEYENIEDLNTDLNTKLTLWESLRDWQRLTDDYKNSSMQNVDAEKIKMQVQKFNKVAVVSARQLEGNLAAAKLQGMVTEFAKLLPAVLALRNRSLQPRHWKKIEETIHYNFSDGLENVTLGQLIEIGVMDHTERLVEISTEAVQEGALDELFEKKVKSVWRAMEFVVNPFKESKEVFILGSVDEIVTSLDDSLVTLNTILGSRYCGHIRLDVTVYQRLLVLLQETLDEWLQCQQQWMYLESIFSAPDIQKQLPMEAKMFQDVDKAWKTIMQQTYQQPNCIKAGTVTGRKENFKIYNNQLERIQKSLEDYLETKRQLFARFYFISNDELLEILSQTRDPQAVQPFLCKCFDALVRLEFGKGQKAQDILAMCSPENERVPLTKNLKARGPVEEWLGAVEGAMKKSLHACMKAAVIDYDERPRVRWIRCHSGQTVATGAQIMWSRGCEAAISAMATDSGALAKWYDDNVSMVRDLVATVRMKISKLERKVIVALVTTDVHARDIVEEMRDAQVDKLTNFTWMKQLRYYWDVEANDTIVRQSNARFVYGYEYMGCTSRLVITPLTDRCWLTITGSIHLKLGAAPAGPAGTGKTESTKDLAKAMGMFCIVFNCSDQIDFKMMATLFAGLAQTGNWTCLDEFNRIQIEVLSVIAQQLFTLKSSLERGDDWCDFEGRKIKVQTFSVNVTMNPGYAGRTALPDNLKVFFRPVAMMIPDYALIAEIMLFAEGFDDSRNLARKMIKMYKLFSEQLSQQRHYDYGLRAVKSVLVMAGGLKRDAPDVLEDITLVRALRDSNVPKFLAEDLPLVFAILSDLFPGLEVPYVDYGALLVGIHAEIDRAGLQRVDSFITKVIQFYDTTNVRFGVCLVGPATGGKTTAYNTLANTMTALHEGGSQDESFGIVHLHRMNPKSITMGELYGEFNELTAEWTDGLASTIMRTQARDETEERQWVTFDGPVDTLWIESLNTVLDDNMTLCLANGERIKLRPQMRIIFECNDLEQASPATVSRVGVVYFSLETVQWLPCVQTWVTRTFGRLGDKIGAHLLSRFEKTMDEGLHFLRKHLREPIKSMDIQLTNSLCSLFTSMWDSAVRRGQINEDDEEAVLRMITQLYSFAFVWTVGGTCDEDSREQFDAWVSTQALLRDTNFNAPDVYASYLDMATGNFAQWSHIIRGFEYDKDKSFFDLVIPTLDTTRFSFVLQRQVEVFANVFFTGVTGTGKTVIVSDLINRMKPDEEEGGAALHDISLNFSAQTVSLQIQQTIEGKLEKKKKTLLGPPGGKKILCIFVDDVNMPAVEEYGAQPPIELLRQIVGEGGMYDRQKLFWRDIDKLSMVLAAAPPGGGRNDITMRFSSQFHVMCIPSAAEAVLESIFKTMLSGFLAAHRFPSSVQDLCVNTVKATIEVYNAVAENLRPTPAKFHYTFNLRDVSKVFQGVMMVGPRQCPDTATFTKLWVHECCRVFHDRLRNKQDQRWFTEFVVSLLPRQFGERMTHEQLFEDKTPLAWCDFLKPGDDAPYELAKSLAQITKVLSDNLEDYNLTNPTQMNLVFFRDAVEHAVRISRILRQPRGNAMLVGVGGSGKQSLTRISCFMADVECFQIELVRGYGIDGFREDLKKLMMTAGVRGKHICFLFVDTQIVDESFLEDINNILNTGEITGLFENDELNKIQEELLPVVEGMGLPGTRGAVWQTFVSRVREKLHMVLCMSPVGDSLRVRCRQYPSLINCCTIDWFLGWPRDALLSVSESFLGNREEIGDQDVRNRLAELCARIHLSVEATAAKFLAQLRRHTYTTPKSYLDLISLYLQVLRERKDDVGTVRRRLAIGVSKMEETNAVVADLQAQLTKLQPVLVQKTAETAELLKTVTREKADAQKVREITQKEEQKVSVKAAEVKVVKEDAQADLDKALPALAKALKSLDSLDKKDISEVKSFAKPHASVQTVMEAVCVLLNEKTDWATAKKVLSDLAFIDRLKDFDKDNIPDATLKKLRKLTGLESMDPNAVAKVSKACTSLCLWCHAMDVYSDVAKEVEPKRKRLAEMSATLDAAMALLASKQADLKAVEDRVADLQQQLENAQAESERLAKESQLTQARLQRAEKLTLGLADEYTRWKGSVGKLDDQLRDLVGDCFLSAAVVSYLGPFTGDYRAEILADWTTMAKDLKIPCSDAFTLALTLSNPVDVRQWQIDGLPTDAVSSDNAVMVTRGQRWPLMIDPEEQAKAWIKRTHKNSLDVVRITNVNMLRSLENCVRIGKPLLIEDIGEFLDPALEPILAKAIFEQSGRRLIRIGDSDVDYDDNFRLFMTTKMPNPHYLPEVCIKVTIINFMITVSGLEDQLLGDVVKKERPEIEVQKNELVQRVAGGKKTLSDLENKILKLLSEAEGNILDNAELVDTLSDAKVTATAVNKDLEIALHTEKEIDVLRQRYVPVAERGALMYFEVANLSIIDPMYQYSLTYYKRLYNRCIDAADASDDLSTRLTNIIEYMTLFVFRSVCRGLFARHELLLSLMMCASILKRKGVVKVDEWNLLLRGAGMFVNTAPNPLPRIISEAGWNLAGALQVQVEAFAGLCDKVTAEVDVMREWGSCKNPESTRIPAGFDKSLTVFQKMLLIKVFREEKLLFAARDFVALNMGTAFVESPPVLMKDLYADTDPLTPIVFILSTGADPTDMFHTFCKTMKMDKKMQLVALGQGQGPRAEAAIEAATESGGWVMLQNCHLGKSWLPRLETIIDSFKDNVNMHPDFRLFVTSMPVQYFPVPILQISIKLTTEPPLGIRQNMTGTLAALDDWAEGFEDVDDRINYNWKKLSFVLTFFHAKMQERRKFGALGFNIAYEFNNTDLDASIKILKMFLNENDYVPWDALLFIVGQISYGGRVTDDWDRRTVMIMLGQLTRDEVLKPDFKFSPSGVYYPPPPGSIDDYIKYVKSLPLADDCEVFGMHDNANISCQMRDTVALLRSSISLQPRVGGGGGSSGKSPDEVVTDLAKEVESKLPGDLNMDDAGSTTFTMNGELMDSLAIVLKQEMVRFNSLLDVIRKNLKEVQMAIRGETLMSDVLDSVYFSLTNNLVPPVFERAAYPSLKPLAAWVKDLVAKLAFMKEWLLHGKPACFWLAGFFFPQGFTTGVLQNHARKYQIPIDTLNFVFEIQKQMLSEEMKESPSDGVYVSGVFIDGAFGTAVPCRVRWVLPGFGGVSCAAVVTWWWVEDRRGGCPCLWHRCWGWSVAAILELTLLVRVRRTTITTGARYDAKSGGLVDCDPGELFTRLPVVHFVPFVKSANPFGPSLIAPEGVYEVRRSLACSRGCSWWSERDAKVGVQVEAMNVAVLHVPGTTARLAISRLVGCLTRTPPALCSLCSPPCILDLPPRRCRCTRRLCGRDSCLQRACRPTSSAASMSH
jgi:dynein heavy chain